MNEHFGELILQRIEADPPILRVVGDVPPVIGISEELLRQADPEYMRVTGSDIYLTVQPENLHYLIIGKSVSHPGVWIAERMDDPT